MGLNSRYKCLCGLCVKADTCQQLWKIHQNIFSVSKEVKIGFLYVILSYYFDIRPN
jgi:hypothetical protein